MEVIKIWTLRGANRWASVPVFEVEMSAARADCEALCRTVLDVQRQVGSPVQFSVVVPMSAPGKHRVVFEYEEEAVAAACLRAAVANETAARLNELRELAHDVRLGPSTGGIVRAARARGIPYRRLGSASLVVLGQGAKQRRVCTAETDATSAIAETIAQDKELTRLLLHTVGVRVPEGRPVSDVEDAWNAAEDLGLPVVVKPRYGNHGRGVATNLSTRPQVEAAYATARQESADIMVEQHIQGDDYRLLVIGGRLVAAALREPAHVVGNGTSSIRQLVEAVNRDPRRSDGHATALSFIKLDAVGLGVLGEQGFTPDSVPPAGQRVLIRRNGNLSTGGTATDVTERVHPDVAARAVEAARVVGLDIAGVDLVALDVARTMEEQRAAVVEVNAGPGLRMHMEPSAGTPRPVGQAIIDMLFPEGDGRIPTVAVTGVNGKTTTTRLLAHLFRTAGHVVGMTCSDGAYLDDRRIDTHDCSGPRSARAMLLNPNVTAAVLETARGGIVREGLGFDRCGVAVVTNIGRGDHLGLRGIETVEELARVKRVVVEAVAPTGAAVLNADDPLVRAMAPHCPGQVVYFTRSAELPGRRGVCVRQGNIVLVDGDRQETVLPLIEAPLTHQGRVAFQIDNVLAATGAAWASGLHLDTMRAGLRTFSGDVRQAPGRFNVLNFNGTTVIVDYAHNASALTALVTALDAFPQPYRTFVFAGCNRRDEEVVEMGTLVGGAFDRVVLYRDRGNSDRADGELQALLERGLNNGGRVKEKTVADSESAAIVTALGATRQDSLVVIGIEEIEAALALIDSHLTPSLRGAARTCAGE